MPTSTSASKTYVNGVSTSPVQIDTTQAATDTIGYVVTDSPGGHQHLNPHRHHRAGDRSRDTPAACITSRRKHIGYDNGLVVSALLRRVQSS